MTTNLTCLQKHEVGISRVSEPVTSFHANKLTIQLTDIDFLHQNFLSGSISNNLEVITCTSALPFSRMYIHTL